MFAKITRHFSAASPSLDARPLGDNDEEDVAQLPQCLPHPMIKEIGLCNREE
jgi:hypothetical protein